MSLEIEKLIILSDGHKKQVNKMVDDLGQDCLNKTKDENLLDVQKIKDTLSGYVLVPTNDLIYLRHGYSNRDEYLDYLAEEYNVEVSVINDLSSFIGQDEDFDGLISALDDMVDSL